MSRWLRRLAYVLGTLVLLIVVLGAFVSMKSSKMLTKKYNLPNEPLTVVTDSASLARGRYLVTVVSKCVECHQQDLGGSAFVDDPAFARIVAPNLTRGKGGVGDKYTDSQMAVAIRHGIKIDSTSAVLMPSEEYHVFTDEDVAAVVAYVRSMPPVDRELPKTELRPVGKTLAALGQLPIFMGELVPLVDTHEATIVRDTSLTYGKYLGNIGGCTGCHGATLSGGKIPGTPPEWPPASNITPSGIKQYSDDALRTILTTGKRPDGTVVNEIMPWKYIAKMTGNEVSAIIKYLRSVPPKEYGNR